MKSSLFSIRSRIILVAFGSLAIGLASGVPTSAFAQSAGNPAVGIAAFSFTPQELTLPQGATVTWTNLQDGVPHTVTALDGTWDSGELSTNDSFAFTFNQTGDFAYECAIHPSMRGVIHIASTPAPAAAAPVAATPTLSSGY
jgi:plastocyanin